MYHNQDAYLFRTLRAYIVYRVVLALLLFFMYEAELVGYALNTLNPTLFRNASLVYVVIALISLAFLFDRKTYQSPVKVSFLLVGDIVALMLLITASGGVNSGLGYLLIITTAIASMYLPAKLALGFAACISILIIVVTVFLGLRQNEDIVKPLFSAGSLGFLVFLTAITFRYLTERIKVSAQEAQEKGEYARQLVQLAQHIVARMRTGVIVIGENNIIELINDSAIQLIHLGKNSPHVGNNIATLGNLESIIRRWQTDPIMGMTIVHKLDSGEQIRLSFASLTAHNRELTIIYVEDYRTLIQQAHQLKLASLGRLTASIAHEIRNPLGAISHAAQLLFESSHLDTSDRRFTEIILQHTHRVNEIVENTSTISKRKEPKAQLIDLRIWIPQFVEEYSTAKNCRVDYEWDENQAMVKMDPSHLRQVLTNLFDNGLRYSMEATQTACIQVRSGLSKNDDTTFIDVIDNGPGVPDDKTQEIFEPFFTTGQNGTGLGLYISRELCEMNQASLNYIRTADNKSRFKINFPHHQRMI